jgi:hypothetical protein
LMSDIGVSLPPPPELIAIGQSSLTKLGQKSSASGCWRMDRAEARPSPNITS